MLSLVTLLITAYGGDSKRRPHNPTQRLRHYPAHGVALTIPVGSSR